MFQMLLRWIFEIKNIKFEIITVFWIFRENTKIKSNTLTRMDFCSLLYGMISFI